MYTGSIDLNKIDESKIIAKDKNGKNFENGAKYLNVVVWINDTPDQYGNNVSIQVSQSKEERDQGVKATYIGNAKEYKKEVPSSEQVERTLPKEDNSDLPF
jgi:hypothetical protein